MIESRATWGAANIDPDIIRCIKFKGDAASEIAVKPASPLVFCAGPTRIRLPSVIAVTFGTVASSSMDTNFELEIRSSLLG